MQPTTYLQIHGSICTCPHQRIVIGTKTIAGHVDVTKFAADPIRRADPGLAARASVNSTWAQKHAPSPPTWYRAVMPPELSFAARSAAILTSSARSLQLSWGPAISSGTTVMMC